ncbi:hypothetical protein K438DRAFT_1789187 [Mycena galopus ATCC 62051]|nr:hypothetical protein K438DRAFT_1789187 [Mycena galopus ATCC 62051]
MLVELNRTGTACRVGIEIAKTAIKTRGCEKEKSPGNLQSDPRYREGDEERGKKKSSPPRKRIKRSAPQRLWKAQRAALQLTRRNGMDGEERNTHHEDSYPAHARAFQNRRKACVRCRPEKEEISSGKNGTMCLLISRSAVSGVELQRVVGLGVRRSWQMYKGEKMQMEIKDNIGGMLTPETNRLPCRKEEKAKWNDKNERTEESGGAMSKTHLESRRQQDRMKESVICKEEIVGDELEEEMAYTLGISSTTGGPRRRSDFSRSLVETRRCQQMDWLQFEGVRLGVQRSSVARVPARASVARACLEPSERAVTSRPAQNGKNPVEENLRVFSRHFVDRQFEQEGPEDLQDENAERVGGLRDGIRNTRQQIQSLPPTLILRLSIST